VLISRRWYCLPRLSNLRERGGEEGANKTTAESVGLFQYISLIRLNKIYVFISVLSFSQSKEKIIVKLSLYLLFLPVMRVVVTGKKRASRPSGMAAASASGNRLFRFSPPAVVDAT
jgi:hypothetical protein